MSWILIAAVIAVGLFLILLLAGRSRSNDSAGYSPCDPAAGGYDPGPSTWSDGDAGDSSFSGGGGDFGGGGATGSWDSGGDSDSGSSGDSGGGGDGGGGDGGGGGGSD